MYRLMNIWRQYDFLCTERVKLLEGTHTYIYLFSEQKCIDIEHDTMSKCTCAI